MSFIDTHTHAFPDKLAARAVPKLAEAAHWSPVGDGTIKGLLTSMGAAGVELSIICSIATKPDQAGPILDWSKLVRSERLLPLPSVHPRSPDPAQWIQAFAKEGFPGIKLHPMYQEFYIDAPELDPIYAACRDCGLFIEMHCGYDIAYPGDDRAAPARLRRALDRFPGMKLVATHMGGWKCWDEVNECLTGGPAWMETSFSMEYLSPEAMAQMITRHGADRVMLGSDWPWATQAREFELLSRLPLTDAQKRGIASENARRLLQR